MNIPSRSPERNTFQKEKYIERCKKENKQPSQEYLDIFDQMLNESQNKFQDEKSRIHNLEYDLVTTEWILEKVRNSDSYAQNLYAAMCNNEFLKYTEVWKVLKEESWGCSWRYAGGIIADMQQKGDYIDWYCSGIKDIGVYAPDQEDKELTKEHLARKEIVDRYVGEGCITEEIREDLYKLGWTPFKENED